MLISKNKKSVRRFGAEDTLVYLVPELCIMTGITDAMRLYKLVFILIQNFFYVYYFILNYRNNFTLMKDMAIHTRVNPKERMDRLTNFANRLLSTPDVNYFHFIFISNISNHLYG